MDPSVDRVGMNEFYGLEFAGAFYEQHDPLGAEQAEAIWVRGTELVESALQTDPENMGLLLHLASFHASRGDRRSFLEVREPNLVDYASQWDMVVLASAYTRLGDITGAVDLLVERVHRGQVFNRTNYFEVLAPELVRSPDFSRFLEADAQLEQELRERYAP